MVSRQRTLEHLQQSTVIISKPILYQMNTGRTLLITEIERQYLQRRLEYWQRYLETLERQLQFLQNRNI